MEREYYSIPEAAVMMGISRIAVFKKVKKGQLAAIRFGRNWAVAISEINRAKSVPGRAPAVAARVQASVAKPRPAAEKPASRNEEASGNTEMDSIGWD